MSLAAFGTIAGGLLAHSAARSQQKAQDAAIQAQMAGFNLAKPYISDMYKGGTEGLNYALDQGYYQGPTYAGLNQQQTDGINSMMNTGQMGANDAAGFMDIGRGFGQNYGNLYNQASQNMLSNAQQYAANNADPLIAQAMRDDYRNLMENTLPQAGVSSSQTGNTNSSRRGVAEAIAQRGFQDRMADTTANIQDRLMNRSLTEQQNRLANMTTANQNLGALYNQGMQNAGANQMIQTGEMLRADEQGRMNDDRARFEGDRDFQMDLYSKYNAGILNNSPQSVGQVPANMVDPLSATVGGMMSGYGFGNQLGAQFAPMQPAVMQAQGLAPNMGSRGMGFGDNPYGF
mgnify:CR=1 FL=1|tara:strand:+ start:1702 stop:2736 length:1035 start_codon:yes stop_codon:yes gene_type:complete